MSRIEETHNRLESVAKLAPRMAKLLEARSLKIVFAESCTAGLCAASLSSVPGISRFLCGGMVVYRNETKTAYLGISANILKKYDAVSNRVAQLMAEAVLARTPEADWAFSVTGHLGPQAPTALDGVVYLGAASRNQKTEIVQMVCKQTKRAERQREVVAAMFQWILQLVANSR
jgi:nicotinamide-nucleotide amidase